MILSTVVLKNLICLLMFDELVITILDPKSYMTPDIVYVPVNLSL